MPCTLVDCADVRLHNAVLRTMPLHCRYTWRTETEADYAAKIDGWVRSLTSQGLVMRSLTSQVLVIIISTHCHEPIMLYCVRGTSGGSAVL